MNSWPSPTRVTLWPQRGSDGAPTTARHRHSSSSAAASAAASLDAGLCASAGLPVTAASMPPSLSSSTCGAWTAGDSSSAACVRLRGTSAWSCRRCGGRKGHRRLLAARCAHAAALARRCALGDDDRAWLLDRQLQRTVLLRHAVPAAFWQLNREPAVLDALRHLVGAHNDGCRAPPVGGSGRNSCERLRLCRVRATVARRSSSFDFRFVVPHPT